MKIEEAKQKISTRSVLLAFITARRNEVFSLSELADNLHRDRGKLSVDLSYFYVKKLIGKYHLGQKRFYGSLEAIEKLKREVAKFE